jgi:hypothetical protein
MLRFRAQEYEDVGSVLARKPRHDRYNQITSICRYVLDDCILEVTVPHAVLNS